MNNKWIAVVNRVDARVFNEEGFTKILEMTNEEGRQKDSDLSTDKPGRAPGNFSGQYGSHALSGEKSPHEASAIHFAKKVCAFLEAQLIARHFDQLLIVAEPKMFGRMRAEMSHNLLGRSESLLKDLGKLQLEPLRQAISTATQAGQVNHVRSSI